MAASANDSITKNFLLISYYWPPSGGVGVQRWLKLCKYLPGENWHPVVLTPENPAFDLKDPELLGEVHADAEVVHLPITEPYHLIQKLSGKKPEELIKSVFLENQEKSFKDKAMRWVRGNLFIPDPRVFWVKPAARFAKELLKANNIQAIITTGPPHSMHLIGLKLKQKTGLPWIADFRDPWTQWEILQRMQPSTIAYKKHLKLERQVVEAADLVLVASPSIGVSLGADPKKIRVLTNGVDPEALQNIQELSPAKPDGKFILQYAGLLNNSRNPEKVWQALEELCREDEDFYHHLEVRLAGQVGEGVLQAVKEKQYLKEKIVVQGYLPQNQVYKHLSEASFLLLLIDNDPAASLIIPAKLFEYLAVQKPILYIGAPAKDAGLILKKEKAGEGFTFEDMAGPKTYIKSLYKEFKTLGTLKRAVNLKPYLRTSQAKQLAQWLDELTPVAAEEA